jgi:hypothetical protein
MKFYCTSAAMCGLGHDVSAYVPINIQAHYLVQLNQSDACTRSIQYLTINNRERYYTKLMSYYTFNVM